jgi:hypothetical protein
MDLTAMKRVESPVKYKQLKPVMNSNSDNHIQYEIQFPAGSMGLELEPVIISSERKIGCRVKDFYFGVDYTGTEEDRSMLQGTISIGDILMKINGVSVVSLPFTSVLDMLRSLTSTERVVVFKNLTKSCKFIESISFCILNMADYLIIFSSQGRLLTIRQPLPQSSRQQLSSIRLKALEN